MADRKSFKIEDAQIIFRNFAGREGQYNQEGNRNFAVILEPDVAEEMAADGWNVKQLRPREEGEEGAFYIQVAVKFDVRPPRIVMLTPDSRTVLDEDTVEVLDSADIETVDLIATGYEWSVNGKSGVKAYLQSLFATLAVDDLERKYGFYSEEEDAE